MNMTTMTNEAIRPTPNRWWWTILIGRRPRWTIVRIVVLVAACYLLLEFVLLPVRVEGVSMLPTYRTGRISLVNRLAYVSREPQRFDIVSIRFSGVSIHFIGKSAMLMKRVVALPGETIAFEDGKLVINGKIIDEPYVKSWCRWDIPPRVLGPDEYYVVGDNRAMPEYEHEKGVATRDRIVGKVML
jgi:signal peptidase I